MVVAADGQVLRPYVLGGDAYAAGQHRGIDVAGPDGSPVRAASGTVTFAGSLPTHGRGVTIATADGYAVTLVHLGAIGVAKGDSVVEGCADRVLGSSGEPEHPAPSVHLGVRVASQPEGYVDPLGLLPPRAAVPEQSPTPPPGQATVPVATRPRRRRSRRRGRPRRPLDSAGARAVACRRARCFVAAAAAPGGRDAVAGRGA